MKVLQDISGKSVAKYAVLPGIIPRLRDLATRGFGELAFMMALLYGSVRLLPAGHPYLRPANKGRFGMRNVIALAASRLVFRRENIDQILVFFALLVAFVLLVLQFVYLAVSFLLHPAMAAGPLGMFDTPQAQRGSDVAFMLLDSVFGIPGFFGSCVDTTVGAGGGACITGSNGGVFPTPFHLGLHALFQFYSLAILLIGVLIFVYYVFLVVGETAMSGTPFGKRFDHIWAPIRLVVALGLLVPVKYGLNSAQYITLFAAKEGSGFATNAWTLYNQSNGMDTPLGLSSTAPAQNAANPNAPAADTTNALIARPQTPEVYPLVQFMSLVQACRAGYESVYRQNGDTGMKIQPWLVDGTNRQLATGAQWSDALTFYTNRDIIIRFGDDGDYDDGDDDTGTTPNGTYPDEAGGVSPKCGEITIHTSDLSGATGGSVQGTALAQKGYYDLILKMWNDPDLINFGTRAACITLKPLPQAGGDNGQGKCTAPSFSVGDDPDKSRLPGDAWKQTEANNYLSTAKLTIVDPTYKNMVQATNFKVSSEILNHGWGGAGIWYNKLAEWNGGLYDATRIIPTPSRMPEVMEKIQNQKAGHDNTLNVCNEYTASQSKGDAPSLTLSSDLNIENMLNDVYRYWNCGTPTSKTELISHGNVVIDAINWIFGSSGIFNLRQNDQVHPLAQLVALGKGIMDATMRNLLISMGFAAGGGFMGAMSGTTMSGLAQIGQQFFQFFTIAGITMGFVMYYILPLMPFIYFFFAVGAWVKAIFEAMVGVPLWALAHLKIAGQGLPAESAMTGYFLILEIFLRPILTVIGLLASIGVLSALIRTLNAIFGLVTSNVTGFDCHPCTFDLGVPGVDALSTTVKRDAYDQFFFTVLYTIIVYLMATSCFKLIDQIPQGVMRWMGSGARPFEDGVGDPVENLGTRVSFGTQLVTQQVIPQLNAGAGLAGSAAGQIANKFVR